VTRLARVVFALLVAATFGAFFVAQRLKGAESVAEITRMTRFFSPNGDGRRDVNRITFTVKEADRVTVTIVDRDGERVRRLVRAPDEVEGPLAAGERVGSVTVLVDGEPVRRVALVTAAEVPGAGTLRVLLSDLGVPLTLLIALAILVAAVLLILRSRLRIRIVR
jgi:hypothetical protein